MNPLLKGKEYRAMHSATEIFIIFLSGNIYKLLILRAVRLVVSR